MMFGMMLLWLLVPAALIWLVAGGFRSSERDAPSALQISEEPPHAETDVLRQQVLESGDE